MPGPITLGGSAAFGFITENGKMASSGPSGGKGPTAGRAISEPLAMPLRCAIV